ncbi:MAG: bifunctional metallophosphatase/5'-nucleotidase [Elusimicrobia bacterium]|nr:bifunctional metallophosphatase/5'-nucleotidase [Elusimicrobiota bacterium]
MIYHTNDAHGWLFSRPAVWDKQNPERKIGGYAALASLVKKEKFPVLLLDSGDIFQGTPEGNLTRGEASISLMNALGYAAMVIGNHEFDFGEENLNQLASLATFPLLGANVYRKLDRKRPEYLKPYIIHEVDGIRFGIFGLVTRTTPRSTLPQMVAHLQFPSEPAEAQWLVKELKKQKVDVVVGLTHVGFVESMALKKVDPTEWTPTAKDLATHGDIEIARKAPGIDILLGGHMHTGLVRPYRDPISGTIISQSFMYLTAATRLELTFDDQTHKLSKVEGNLVDLWVDEVGEDPQAKDRVDYFVEKVGKDLDQVIGEAVSDIKRRDKELDSPIGNWMTDIMRQKFGADIAFQNTYGIRNDIFKGPISMRHVFSVMPFDNTLVTLEMKGKHVLELVQDNLIGPATNMQMSGLKVQYRISPGQDKPKEIKIQVGDQPLQINRAYRVVTNNYLTTGGTGGEAFKLGSHVKDTGIPIRSVLMDYVKKNSPIRPPKEQRIQLLNDL